MKHSKLITHVLFDVPVDQAFDDGYVNVTKLSNAYFNATGKRRQPSHWIESKRTHEMIEHLSGCTGKPAHLLVRQILTGPNEHRGTYIHPRLAVRYGIWLSDEFGFAIEQMIAKWSTDFSAFLDARQDGKLIHRQTTDAIQRSGFNERHHYINAAQVVYRSLFGMTAKELKESRGCDEKANLRDVLTSYELHVIKTMEARLVKELDEGNHESYQSFYAAAKAIGERFKQTLI